MAAHKGGADDAAKAEADALILGREWPELIVSGCTDQTISHIVKGTYRVVAMNHSKPVYKKYEKAKGLDVLVYFWDDRDGLELCGWWFGPAVGGDQVWAFHPSRTSTTPPASEWNIPNDGPIDATFTIQARPRQSADAAEPAKKGHDEDKKGSKEDPAEDAVRKQIESMKKEREEFEKRMEEIQRRADERKKREEELKKRLREAEGQDKTAEGRAEKRQKADEEEQRRRKEAALANARAEEERRRLEEDARQKKEEDRRRTEEEARTRRDEEAQRRHEERVRQEEEAAKKKAEKRKKEEEEERKRREVEDKKRKEEDEKRRKEEAKRQEERQRKLNEEAKKKKEEVCTLGVLDALSRLANAMPEDYDLLKTGLDKVLEHLLPYTGKRKSALKTEAEKVVRRTEAFVRQVEEQHTKWEQWHELAESLPASMRG